MPKHKPATPPAEEFDASIDEAQLDRAWLEQPDRYYRWAARLADAKREFEEAKQALAAEAAEISMAIRLDPAAYDLAKATDASVEAATIIQTPYRRALAIVNQARHRVDVLTAAVTALDHRKKALENLVYLHGQNYYAAPRARPGSEGPPEDRGWGVRHAPPKRNHPEEE